MRLRQAQRLAAIVQTLPDRVPEWVTPEMVVEATPLDGLDLIAAEQMRTRRMALLVSVMRAQLDAITRQMRAAHDDVRRTAGGHGLAELRPAPKMDTPTGLFRAVCACGKETAAGSKTTARTAWQAHADAKTAPEE